MRCLDCKRMTFLAAVYSRRLRVVRFAMPLMQPCITRDIRLSSCALARCKSEETRCCASTDRTQA